MNGNKKEIGFLFDLDGVLIDSESEYTRIWRQINREYPTGVENMEILIKGYTLSKILNDYYDKEETRLEVSKRLHELENDMHYDYLPFAEEFLKILKELGQPCALVTSSDTKKMSHLREELPDIFNYFNFIVTGDLVKTSKPSPEGYLLGAKKIYRNAKNCVVFEDSEQGVMAGENAGCLVVGIRGTVEEQRLRPHSHFIINNFKEIDLEELVNILQERT